MLKMTADILLLILCFTCVYSYDQQQSCKKLDFCKTHKLSVPLDSSVLLPCSFSRGLPNWVSWTKVQKTYLVHLHPKGQVRFVDPKQGRVKTFPNGGSSGNFSIRIDKFETSDQGCYRCEHGRNCVQVELVAEKGPQSITQEMGIFISVAMVAVILLLIGSYFCIKRICHNVPSGQTPSAPPQEQQRGVDSLVYENDDQCPSYWQSQSMANQASVPGVMMMMNPPVQGTSRMSPNPNPLNFERMESHRRKLRFHRDLFNRLRPASFSRHYYANQADINKQQATQAGNHQRDFDYNNPIYNRSTEYLGHP